MVHIKFLYKASNKAGQTVEGIIEATDRKAVLNELRSKSLYLLNLSEVNPKSAMDINFGSAKIPKKVLGIFCTQFSSILKAGVPLTQALTILDEQLENPKLKKIIQNVNDDLQRGKSLSEAFSAHEKALPSIMIKMIEAGEISGTLDLSLERLALHFEKEYNINKKIKSAMMYPIVICVIAMLVVVFMLLFVVPQFMGFFASTDAELPGVTQFLLSLSDLISNGWMYIIGVIVLLVMLFKVYKSTPDGRLKLDTLKLKAPLFGKSFTNVLTARLSRTLATLSSAGITLTQSIRIASKVVANKMAENKLLDIEDQIKQGLSFNASIKNAGIFPGMLMHMSKIGEESGKLDEMLEKAAEYFEEEADTAISRMTTIIQPILLIFVAGIILFIMLSVLLPIFSIYSSM